VSITSQRAPHPLGTHRVLEPLGAMPQNAHKLDNTPAAFEGELLCDVDVLNIDSASFRQIADASDRDASRIAEHVLAIVRERGKMHNPVTGSGGMFIGTICATGERIASLVSLTLTPLHIDSIERVDVGTGRIWVRGSAILFATSLWAVLPDDIDENVALAVLDVAGAPAQTLRLCKEGQTVVVVGADGKSGMLACAQAKARVGSRGRVIGIAPSNQTLTARLLIDHGYVDAFIVADARDALGMSEALARIAPELADVTINCVNVPGTELGSILCTKDGGIVYFFSMSTSFTAAALGAEGVARDVTMIVGNGYARDHAQIALQTLRDHPEIHTHFKRTYAAR
jgi:L-erythro-3,5-diaminohexanoate dehydrogenase